MTPIDALILTLIDTQQQASASKLTAILDHVAQAPFAMYLARIPNQLRQLFAEKDIHLPAKLSSLEIHYLKRVAEEEQWPKDTTPAQYVADLQQAIHHPQVQVWFYRYYGQPFAGFLSPSHVPISKGAQAYLFVVYSPLYGTITTGYQASGVRTIFTDGYTDLKRQQ